MATINTPFEDSATIGSTEYSLPNDGTTLTARTDQGCYQLYLDLADLALGDEYELKVYEKAVSGGTQRLAFKATFANAQVEPLYVAPSLMLKHGWDMTMKKLAGTDRSIAWSIRTP